LILHTFNHYTNAAPATHVTHVTHVTHAIHAMHAMAYMAHVPVLHVACVATLANEHATTHAIHKRNTQYSASHIILYVLNFAICIAL
jgi:hypothetical protein